MTKIHTEMLALSRKEQWLAVEIDRENVHNLQAWGVTEDEAKVKLLGKIQEREDRKNYADS